MRDGNNQPAYDTDDDESETELHRLEAFDQQRRAGTGKNRARHDLAHVVPVGAFYQRDRIFAHRGGLDLEDLGSASRAEGGLRIRFGTALRTSHLWRLCGHDRRSSNHRQITEPKALYHFDPGAMVCSSGEFAIAGDQRRIKCLRQSDISGIIGGKVMA